MSFVVKYASLEALLGAYNSAVSNWSQGISQVMGQANAIKASSNIAGNGADSIKAYLNTAYSFASGAMNELLELFVKGFTIYLDDYYQQVDASDETFIEETELSDRRTDLQGKRSPLQQIGIDAQNAIRDITDLVALPGLDTGDIEAQMDTIINSLDALDNAVNGLESAHAAADFVNIDALIAQLDAFFMELIGKGEEFKTDFSMESFASLASIPALLQTMNDSYDQLSAQESQFVAAAENLEKRLEQRQAEMEQRKETADTVKLVTKIVVGVGAVALSTVCPLAAPVMAGVIIGTISATADEYAAHGTDFDQWDRGRIGINACVGGVSGLIGGFIPGGAGVVAKAAIKSVSGALGSAALSGYDQLAAYGTITDTESVIKDAVTTGVSSFAGNLVGGAISDSIKTTGISSLDLARDDPLSSMHFGAEFLFEGGKGLGIGVIERGISNLTGQAITLTMEGGISELRHIDMVAMADDMFSVRSMVGDFVGDGLSGATGDYLEWRTPDEDTGLTPIIQYKLGNTPDPETGTAPIVDEALRTLEVKQQWEKEHLRRWQPNYWNTTSLTPEEILTIEEMERNGELEIPDVDPSPAEREHLSLGTAENGHGQSAANPGFSEALHDPNLFTSRDAKDYRYEEGEHGKTAAGVLGIEETPIRDPVAQREVGGEERRETDDGGHLIGARYGGAPGKENMDAQDRNLNRGAYKSKENEWENSLDNGDQVYAHVETYKGEGAERPDAYTGWTVTEDADGNRDWDAFSYTNESAATQEQWEDEVESVPVDDSPNPMNEVYEKNHYTNK